MLIGFNLFISQTNIAVSMNSITTITTINETGGYQSTSVHCGAERVALAAAAVIRDGVNTNGLCNGDN